MEKTVKKKVLVATGLYPPDIGGPATYAQMLEEELPKAGIEPVIVPFGTVRHLPKIVRHIAFAFALYKRVRECDALYALAPISVGVPALLVSKLTGKPFLIRLGGDYAWEQGRMRFGLRETLDEYTEGSRTGRPYRVRMLAWIQSFVVRRAQFVVAPSEYLKSIIATWSVPAERIVVIHSALLPLPITETREVMRRRLSYEGTVLISSGRLTPWKGFSELIELVAKLKEDIDDVSLVIAGDGEMRAELEDLAMARGVEDRIRFVGRLSKEALGAAISGADIFVQNTSYEGLPHQLLEVMDIGVPVISTNIPGNKEIIVDGVQGLLVSPNDVEGFVLATKRILESEQLKNRLTQNAHLRIKDFSQEKVTKLLIDLLRDI